MNVRRAEPEEQASVEALSATDPATKDFAYLWRRYRHWAEASARPIVAVDGDVIVGFHAAAFGSTTVNSYYQLTAPAVRGHGVGGAMVEFLIAEAHRLGCARLKFKVPFASDGQRFWEGFGLHAFGEDDRHLYFDVSLVGVHAAADLAHAVHLLPVDVRRRYKAAGVRNMQPVADLFS